MNEFFDEIADIVQTWREDPHWNAEYAMRRVEDSVEYYKENHDF